MSTQQIAAIAIGVTQEWLSQEYQDKLEKIGGRVFNSNAKSPFFGIPFVEVSDTYKELNLGNIADGRFVYDLFVLSDKFNRIAGVEPTVVIICDTI